MKQLVAFALAALMLCACVSAESALNAEKKPAAEITAQKNAEVYQQLDFSDEREAEFASRGLIAAPDSLTITAENGMTIWSQDKYNFVREAESAPDTANPSLWRNTQQNALYGLFQVTDDIYQVRGYDVSNITFIRSAHGWIVMDCASSRYTAAEALKLFRSELGDDPIVAIVISHAHVDHYGGIEGLISAEDAADPSLTLEQQIASGKTAIIVPQGFVDAVMKENVFVGSAMKRDLPVRQLFALWRAGAFVRGHRPDCPAERHGICRAHVRDHRRAGRDRNRRRKGSLPAHPRH